MKKVLALDWGLKKTGAALGENGGLAQILPSIDSSTRQKLLDKVDTLAQDHNVEIILIGFPSTHIQNTKKIMRIKKMLEDRKYEVVLWEETLTTKEAKKELAASGHSEKSIQKNVHSTAAALMLEEYLNF